MPLARRAPILAVLLAVAWLAGCGSGTPTPVDETPSQRSPRRTGPGTSSLLAASALNVLRAEGGLPGPTAYQRAADSLNRWLGSIGDDLAPPAGAEAPPPALLSEPQRQSLSPLRFTPDDAALVERSLLCRDVARARALARDDLDNVAALFDWVVRNVQLVAAPEANPDPYNALLLGRGTAAERAWLFAELLRQLGIEAVFLFLDEPHEPSAAPWVVAVPLADDLFLFDPTLGLAPLGRAGRPATLDELDDPDAPAWTELASLDDPSGVTRPQSAADLHRLVPMAVCSLPRYSRRMALLERQLAGTQSVVLTHDFPRFIQTLDRAAPQIAAEVLLWNPALQPPPSPVNDARFAALQTEFQGVARQGRSDEQMPENAPNIASQSRYREQVSLGTARLLHLRAVWDQSRDNAVPGARRLYGELLAVGRAQEGLLVTTLDQLQPGQRGRVLAVDDLRDDPELTADLRAGLVGQDVRFMAASPEGDFVQIEARGNALLLPMAGASAVRVEVQSESSLVLDIALDSARFWLALAHYEAGSVAEAARQLGMYLGQTDDLQQWQQAALYNLARCYEAQGNYEEAAAVLLRTEGPQAPGNRLRAARLRERLQRDADTDAGT